MFSFLYHCQEFYWSWLSIWVTQRVSCKKQELHTLHEHLISAPFFYGIYDADFFLVFCVALLCVFAFWVPCCDVRYDFRIKTMFDSSLPAVVCSSAHVLFTLFVFAYVSNTYCVVFLFSFSSSCVPYVANFSRLSISDRPFGIL